MSACSLDLALWGPSTGTLHEIHTDIKSGSILVLWAEMRSRNDVIQKE